MGDYGLFRTTEPVRVPHIILMRNGEQFTYSATRNPRHNGRVYPTAEVVAIARNQPRILDATVVFDRAGRFGQAVRILIAFTGVHRPTAEDDCGMRQAIAHSLGPDFVPDYVHLVPLYPRTTRNGDIDSRWCETQQVTGGFYHRPRKSPQQALTLLRRAVELRFGPRQEEQDD
jgi:hypothetical protein